LLGKKILKKHVWKFFSALLLQRSSGKTASTTLEAAICSDIVRLHLKVKMLPDVPD
jgi:hypothetical protein